jgi:DNA-binding CsgD family transcriptional regulator
MPSETLLLQRMLLGTIDIAVLRDDRVHRWQSTLSRSEKEVVEAALRGYTNAEIAVQRGRSIRTVVNQLASAFEKMGVHSRRELMSKCAGFEA